MATQTLQEFIDLLEGKTAEQLKVDVDATRVYKDGDYTVIPIGMLSIILGLQSDGKLKRVFDSNGNIIGESGAIPTSATEAAGNSTITITGRTTKPAVIVESVTMTDNVTGTTFDLRNASGEALAGTKATPPAADDVIQLLDFAPIRFDEGQSFLVSNGASGDTWDIWSTQV